MHKRHQSGDPDVRPNVVTYGAVIDAHAKSGERGAAARADALLAAMIQQHQSDPDTFWDLRPNTYVFNTVINCWAKSKEQDAAAKAEEMLVAMGRLHLSGNADLKPDAFTYTAVIDVSGNDLCVCVCVSRMKPTNLMDQMSALIDDGHSSLIRYRPTIHRSQLTVHSRFNSSLSL